VNSAGPFVNSPTFVAPSYSSSFVQSANLESSTLIVAAGPGFAPLVTALLFASPVQAAVTDWATATTAAVLVADVSGPETAPGAAVLTGAFTALGRPVLARHPRPVWTFAHGREPNHRNLMVQYAVRHWFTDLPEPPPLGRW